jgi:hypothetical protein
MLDNVALFLITGAACVVIGAYLESRTGWFTRQVASGRAPEHDRHGGHRREPVVSGAELAQAVRDARDDSTRVDMIRNYMKALYEGQLSGKELAEILGEFRYRVGSYRYDALRVIAPKVDWPISSKSRSTIIAMFAGSGYEAEAAEILARTS